MLLSVNEENVGDGEEGCDRSLLLAKCLTKAAPQVSIYYS